MSKRIDLEYMEGPNNWCKPDKNGSKTQLFHVERIMDFLTQNLPLCLVHQTRTIIFFCYLFAILIEFLLYPPYSVGNTPFTFGTLFLPLIIVLFLHFILSIAYIAAAGFERASCRTVFGLMFFLHAPLALVMVIGVIVLVATNFSNLYFSLSIIVTVAVLLDFLCGFISRPRQIVILSFEILAAFPMGILTTLYFNKTIKDVWVPFLPPFIYFGIYFIVLLFLVPTCCCKGLNACTLKMLADIEIKAEYEASGEYQSFKGKSTWAGDSDDGGSDHGSRKKSRSRWSKSQGNIASRKFPSEDSFQLYNTNGLNDNYLYLASPFPMLALVILLSVILIHLMSPLPSFYIWLLVSTILLIAAILLNSRVTACTCCAITNIDDKDIDVLWDHPALSLL